MFSVTLTLWNQDGSVVGRGTTDYVSEEKAQKAADYQRKTNTMFGGVEGKTFTVEVKTFSLNN